MNQQHIRPRILVPLSLAFLVVVGLALVAFERHTRYHLGVAIDETRGAAARLLTGEINQDAELLRGLLDLLTMDPCLREGFQSRDRERLMTCAGPLFQDLKRKYRVTHFYLHDPEGVNVLRVHNPERYGDRIDRFTLQTARAQTVTSAGIELGPLGTFTLRAVQPWVVNGDLIGYLELGEEIEHILPRLRDLMGADLVVLIYKQFLTRDGWAEGQRMLGKTRDWDDLPDAVIIGETFPANIEAVRALLAREPTAPGGTPAPKQLELGGRALIADSAPLRDAGGRVVGEVLVFADVTAERASEWRLMSRLTVVSLGIGALLFTFFWFYLGRIQGALSRVHANLEATIQAQQATADELRAKEERLAGEIAHRERRMAEEHTLGVLMHLSLADEPVSPMLQQSLEALLGAVPWLQLRPQGGIFLARGHGTEPTLDLVAAYNLSPQVREVCASIEPGFCLCGAAAATREIQYSAGADPRHVAFTDQGPGADADHGHYNVPILHGDTVLGVLVLYLAAGHPRSAEEQDFLSRVADVLSSGILRSYARDDLVAAKETAEGASRSKSEFLASMSHEIRTPMNGVLGMAELLGDMNLTFEQREFVETIKKSGQALLTIINDILDFSKIEAGRFVLEPIPFDLEGAAHDVAQLLSARAEEKGLELILHFATDCPRHLIGDAGRIRQVLLNLAGNAIKFTERGYVVIDIGNLGDANSQPRIHIQIQDTGIGISAEVREKLFQSFVQAEASTTRRYGGTGLGLAISRQLVELMGGEIGVRSTPGKGSTFWFTLPLPTAVAIPNPLAQADLHGVRVLVVDDNPVNQRVFKEQLKGFGMEARTLGDPREALPALRMARTEGHPFELVLLDHMMPDMDGEEVARAIQADPTLAGIPLLLLTSAGQRGDSEHFKAAGFSAYLIKPVLIDTLRRSMAGVLAARASGDATGGILTRHTVAEAVLHEESTTPHRVRSEARVLLAEDNSVNRKVALAMLRRLGIDADCAENGREAVERCAVQDYDLILMDCQMPEMDGYEATRQIRIQERGRRVAIVALTANAMESDRQNCLAAGMDDYVSKPFKPHDLTGAVERWLDRAD